MNQGTQSHHQLYHCYALFNLISPWNDLSDEYSFHNNANRMPNKKVVITIITNKQILSSVVEHQKYLYELK